MPASDVNTRTGTIKPENCGFDTVTVPPSVMPRVFAKRKTAHQLRVEQLLKKIREHSDKSELPSSPTIPAHTIVLKQAKLIVEEMLELLEACGIALYVSNGQGPCTIVTREDSKLVMKAKPDMLDHIAKEIADLSVVTTGMFSEFGIADVSVLEEVDVNNLGKFGPGGHLDENNKWIKPLNHPTPDIWRVLNDQGWNKAEVSHEEIKTSAGIPVSSSGDGQQRQEEASPC